MNGFDENLESASCHQLGIEATAPIFLEREWFLTDDEFDGWPRTYRLSGHPSGDVGRCTMYLAGRLDDAEYGCQVALVDKFGLQQPSCFYGQGGLRKKNLWRILLVFKNVSSSMPWT